jgi:hypothetical protein
MKAILKFKTFNTTEDFEKWQAEVEPTMHQIYPVPNDFDATERPNSTPFGIDGSIMRTNLSFGILVTYWINPEEKQ